jgi:chromosome segregation ATPase
LQQGILSASTSILNHFSSALSQYAAHGHSMRDQLKAIRTKEEALDDLERRRRSFHRKVEEADKKLSKMTPDNKSFTVQTDTLNRLKDDIQTLDSDIMSEEAAVDKFKRSATRVWMGLKFGGLVECCQKGKVRKSFSSFHPILSYYYIYL